MVRAARVWRGRRGPEYMITPIRNGFAPTLPGGRAQQPEPRPTKKPTQNSKSMLYAGIIPRSEILSTPLRTKPRTGQTPHSIRVHRRMRIKRKIGELGMSLGGSLLLKRKGKSVILCGTAGAGFPVALGAPTPAQECGVAAPYSASGILLAR